MEGNTKTFIIRLGKDIVTTQLIQTRCFLIHLDGHLSSFHRPIASNSTDYISGFNKQQVISSQSGQKQDPQLPSSNRNTNLWPILYD